MWIFAKVEKLNFMYWSSITFVEKNSTQTKYKLAKYYRDSIDLFAEKENFTELLQAGGVPSNVMDAQ